MNITDKKINKLAIYFLIAFGLSSCGGGSTSDDNNTGTGTGTGSLNGTKIGLVTVAEANGEVELNATFFQYANVVAEAQIREDLKPSTLDVCTVSPYNGFSIPNNSLTGNLTTISAGNTLQFSDAIGGSFAEINKQITILTTYVYDDNNGNSPLLGPIPNSFIVDVVGDVFPPFSNVTVPTIDVLTSASPSGFFNAITADTVFTWNAPTSSTSFMEISFFSVNVLTSKGTYVECVVTDDGQFTLAQTTKDELSAAGFTSTSSGASFIRKEINIVKQGDAYLSVERQDTF